MARQPDIQYVRFYTSGSAARKLEPQGRPSQTAPKTQSQARPRVRRDPRKVIRIDPLALCAMVVAGVMLIAMAIGMIKLGGINSDVARMDRYVDRLQAENAQLQAEYEAGYDMDRMEQNAQELGMVPVGQVQHIQMEVDHSEPAPQPSGWENFKTFWTELFA